MVNLFDFEKMGIDSLDPRWQDYLDHDGEKPALVYIQPTLSGIYLVAATEDIVVNPAPLGEQVVSITNEHTHIYFMGALDPSASTLSEKVLYTFDENGQIEGFERERVAGTGDYPHRAAIDKRLAFGFELLAQAKFGTNIEVFRQSIERNLATLRKPGSQSKRTEGTSLNHRI